MAMPSVMADGTLTGRVTDEASDPVPFATVQIEFSGGTKTGTITNDLGEYSINLPAASYGVTVTSIGYEPIAHKIALADESTLLLDIALPYSAVEMNEVIVRGNFDPDDMLLYLDKDVVEPGGAVSIGVDENTRGIGESIVTYRYSIESFRKPDGAKCEYVSSNPHDKFTCLSDGEGIYTASVDLVFGDDTYSQAKLIRVSRDRRISRAVANLNVLSVSATDSDSAFMTYGEDDRISPYRCSPGTGCPASTLYCTRIDYGCKRWKSHFSSTDFAENAFDELRQLRLRSGSRIHLTAMGSKIDGEDVRDDHVTWYFIKRDDLFGAPTVYDLSKDWVATKTGEGRSLVTDVAGSKQGYIVALIDDGWSSEMIAYIPVEIFGGEPAAEIVYAEEESDAGAPITEEVLPSAESRCIESDVSAGYEDLTIYNSPLVQSFCIELKPDGSVGRRIDDRVVDGENQETYCDAGVCAYSEDGGDESETDEFIIAGPTVTLDISSVEDYPTITLQIPEEDFLMNTVCMGTDISGFEFKDDAVDESLMPVAAVIGLQGITGRQTAGARPARRFEKDIVNVYDLLMRYNDPYFAISGTQTKFLNIKLGSALMSSFGYDQRTLYQTMARPEGDIAKKDDRLILRRMGPVFIGTIPASFYISRGIDIEDINSFWTSIKYVWIETKEDKYLSLEGVTYSILAGHYLVPYPVDDNVAFSEENPEDVLQDAYGDNAHIWKYNLDGKQILIVTLPPLEGARLIKQIIRNPPEDFNGQLKTATYKGLPYYVIVLNGDYGDLKEGIYYAPKLGDAQINDESNEDSISQDTSGRRVRLGERGEEIPLDKRAVSEFRDGFRSSAEELISRIWDVAADHIRKMGSNPFDRRGLG
ncbi:MAG: carboxypeptidase-like regulatory domain-containing protein [archaeon]